MGPLRVYRLWGFEFNKDSVSMPCTQGKIKDHQAGNFSVSITGIVNPSTPKLVTGTGSDLAA